MEAKKTAQTYSENLYRVFCAIKGRTDEMLSLYNNKILSEDPSVDIEKIALNIGIAGIFRVPAEVVQNEHSLLVAGNIIYLNKDKKIEEQRFSIAHETAHYLLREEHDGTAIARVAANSELYDNIGKRLLNIAAAIKFWSKRISTIVSSLIGKPVSEKKVSVVLNRILAKAFYEKTGEFFYEEARKKIRRGENSTLVYFDNMIQILENKMKDDFFGVINKLYAEEIADYFAANLLVPTERFILWEDKPDEEIAHAFGVTERCIQKRREEEIEHELYFMSPKNLSSDVEIEEEAPASCDELDRVLEGFAINDTGRV